MKRKTILILIPVLLIAIIAGAVLLYTAAGSREYYFSDLLSLRSRTKENSYHTGGSISMDDLPKYRIVYSLLFSEEEIALVEKLRDVIYENTGISLEVCSTEEGKTERTYTVTRHELLIGYTFRPESVFMDEQTWEGASSCAMVGKKLVLSIGDAADTEEMLNRFIDRIEQNCRSGTGYFFRDSDAYTDTGSAPVDTLILNGLPITEYTILQTAEEDSSHYEESVFLAETFRQRLGDICGYLLPLQDASQAEPDSAGVLNIGIVPTFDSLLNMHFSPNAESDTWHLTGEGTAVTATGTASYCTSKAIDALIQALTPPAPTETYTAEIGPADPVSINTDLSILRIDMMEQWPAIPPMRKYLFNELPDLFILENASDSLGGRFTDDFDGYYTGLEAGYLSNVYYCTSRFQLIEEGKIDHPKDGGFGNTLYGYYIVLEDVLTFQEFVVFISDVSENSITAFQETVQYLRYPDRDMICFGTNVPDEAKALFNITAAEETDRTLCAMLTDAWEIADLEDRTDEIIRQQEMQHRSGVAYAKRICFVCGTAITEHNIAIKQNSRTSGIPNIQLLSGCFFDGIFHRYASVIIKPW